MESCIIMSVIGRVLLHDVPVKRAQRNSSSVAADVVIFFILIGSVLLFLT